MDSCQQFFKLPWRQVTVPICLAYFDMMTTHMNMDECDQDLRTCSLKTVSEQFPEVGAPHLQPLDYQIPADLSRKKPFPE